MPLPLLCRFRSKIVLSAAQFSLTRNVLQVYSMTGNDQNSTEYGFFARKQLSDFHMKTIGVDAVADLHQTRSHSL